MHRQFAMNPFAHSFSAFLQLSRLSQEMWTSAIGSFAHAMLPPMNDNAVRRHPSSTIPFDTLAVGQSYSAKRRVTQEDINAFAYVTGDENPAHVHPKGVPPFNAPIAHGMLVGSAISAILAMKLPGPGTIYLEQSFKFRKPIYAGEMIEASVTISDLLPEKRRVTLDTVVRNQEGAIAIEGTAVVMVAQS